MIIDLRKTTRNPDFLPITVNAVNGVDGTVLAGPFSCRILDISSHGACLLMTQVLKNRFHVFHTTREHDSNMLQLVITVPPDENHHVITARPVWLDIYKNKDIRAFKIGVEFLVSPQGKQIRQLEETLSKNRSKRQAWWKKFK